MGVVTIERKVLEKNDTLAAVNRDALVRQGVFAINLVSSPGAGKTSLLERTIEHLRGAVRMAVVEGDVQTDLDARRVARYGVPVVQIVTNGGCHLEARLVQDALARLDLSGTDLLVIENVGNLVCPAEFRVGEDVRGMVCSVTEGEDKPLKYPLMFRACEMVVVNKVDLLEHLDFDLERLLYNLDVVNPGVSHLETSAKTGEGIEELAAWFASVAERSGAHAGVA